MELCDINPFMRAAELQPFVTSSAPLGCAYDFRIFYILDRKATLVLEDRSIALEPGMLIYFRPATPYYFEGKVRIIVLNFDLTRNKAHEKEPRSPSRDLASFDEKHVLENDPPAELKDLIVIPQAFEMESKLYECVQHRLCPDRSSDAVTSALIKEILCYIVQKSSGKQERPPAIVQQILLFIQKNSDRPISNEMISAEFGYHSFYLNRVFKKSTGMTLHQAVTAEKMHIAEQMLQETTLPVNVVAAEVGFLDCSQFCTAFKKHTGYAPTGYRRKNCTHRNLDKGGELPNDGSAIRCTENGTDT